MPAGRAAGSTAQALVVALVRVGADRLDVVVAGAGVVGRAAPVSERWCEQLPAVASSRATAGKTIQVRRRTPARVPTGRGGRTARAAGLRRRRRPPRSRW